MIAMPHPMMRVLLVANALVLLDVLTVQFGSDFVHERSFQEDAWGEWATFWAYLLAGAAGLCSVCRSLSGRGRFENVNKPGVYVMAALSFFCLVVAGEEVSWGQRMFGFAAPEIFLQHNYQQELNLHNFLRPLSIRGHWQLALVSFLYGIAWPLLGRLQVIRRHAWGEQAARLSPPLAFVPFHMGVIGLALGRPFHYCGEVAELALALVFASDLALRTAPADWNARRATLAGASLFVSPLLLGVVSVPLTDGLGRAGEQAQFLKAEAELEKLAGGLTFAHQEGRRTAVARWNMPLFSLVESQVLSTQANSEFLKARAAEGDTVRGSYFLDPWNSPYWVFWPSGRKHVVVYSLGANRRRESTNADLLHLLGAESDGAAALRGDDRGFRITLRN